MQPLKPTKLNPASNIDYKELQKTLIHFQRAQLELEKTRQGSPLKSVSPMREMINFQALQDAGLIELNEKSKQVDGVKITLEEIEKAFKILDEKNKGSKISLLELKKKIPAINPNFPKSEYKALTQGKPELKSKDLYELLKQNELQDFDPLEQAFSLLDPKGEGNLDINRLGEVFSVLGYGKIDKRDQEILLECLDVDKDGKIGLQDLREIFESERHKQ
ncbi:unnamed protein product (macronuclear) [Paramecium tetraurelia]|uniref:EF-hand domain-containing protein n=1 Tax=Paramecium tetraurelia TaxID=5888 RepID=A0C6I2_PARTE|nr:uncharacterized protein GSPATT00035528001 [Paramecium tetraurelia]CAK66399.1 unnamed protein product [Paramecium tetraurelia]|eukprot:XP_001433796.1 hypothetical protein (macronuclear) [Paramecium tetraurelia strain d4-2]